MKRTVLKLLAALLALLSVLSVACSQNAPQAQPSDAEQPTAAPTAVPTTVPTAAPRSNDTPIIIPEGRSYALLSMTDLPEGLDERRLSDEEIAALKDAPMDTLKEAFSSFADYVAWMETMPKDLFWCDCTGPQGEITLDANEAYSWLKQVVAGVHTVGIAQHVLSDDYPGMKIVILVTQCEGGRTVTYGNAFPHGDGYYVLSVFPFVQTTFGYFDVFRPIYLEDFSAIVDYAEGSDITWGWGDAVTQVITLDTDEGMILSYDEASCTFRLSPQAYTTGSVTNVYLHEANVPEAPSVKKTEVDLSALGEYRLLPKTGLPEALAERRLSDGEIQSLSHAGVLTLRDSISGFADYIAWVKTQSAPYYCDIISGENKQLNLDPIFNYQWAEQMIGGKMIASMAMYVLGDDNPSVQMALIVTASGTDLSIAAANIFPAEDGGYYVLAADSFAFAEDTAPHQDVIEPLWVSDLSGLVRYGLGEDIVFGGEGTLAQVIVFDNVDNVTVSAPNGYYVVKDIASAKELYVNPSAGNERKTAGLRFAQFGFPDALDLSTGIDEKTAKEIREGTVEEAAARLNSIADVISYFYYAFEPNMAGDICYNVPGTDLGWHFNYAPALTFQRDVSSCGAVSGLVEYLLDGDYDEVGIIGMSYVEGGGGGHVINYFKSGEYYCTVDFNGYSTSGFQSRMLGVHYAKTLDEAVVAYTGTDGYVKLAYTYQSLVGDMPVGWDSSHLTRVVNGYGTNFHIVFETPDEGYCCVITDVDERTAEIILAMRTR